MSYVDELEQQNEQLRQKLAVAEMWVPEWVKEPNGGNELSVYWNYTNGYFIHAKIKHDIVDDHFYVTLMNNKNVEYITTNFEAAKEAAMNGLSCKRIRRDRNREAFHG